MWAMIIAIMFLVFLVGILVYEVEDQKKRLSAIEEKIDKQHHTSR